MKTNPIRMGYSRQSDGSFRKRVEFDVPGKPGVVLVKYLRRDSAGTLLPSGRGEWMREKAKPQLTA